MLTHEVHDHLNILGKKQKTFLLENTDLRKGARCEVLKTAQRSAAICAILSACTDILEHSGSIL